MKIHTIFENPFSYRIFAPCDCTPLRGICHLLRIGLKRDEGCNARRFGILGSGENPRLQQPLIRFGAQKALNCSE